MKKQYHILNGDALKNKFPKTIHGEIIVARECLVDGPVKGDSLGELYKTRTKFLNDNYGRCSEQDYFMKVVTEFQKIQSIPEEGEINLWFEDDLFCQVNFWFVIWLLQNSKKRTPIFLVRPHIHNQYGFGGLNESELNLIYKNRILLTELEKVTNLWKFYQNNKTGYLLKIATELEHIYPFILPAVKAHLDRIPSEGKLTRPTQSLIQIMKDLKTEEFGPIFMEFSNRENIYGYGDLQVKRIFDTIKSDRIKGL